VEKLLDDYTPPDGVTITMGGETDDVNEMVIEMAKMIALAILFVYLVMVAQFQSLLAPFIVLFTMPLAFTGGMLALLIAGEQLSMMSMVGFLVLVGVIVNNGIVFVDYVNQLRLGGVERTEALVATGRTRMRPILMTALTTIFAMTMMIFSQDTGSQMGHGMALVVVGGLVYGTLMTLFIVPVMYDLFFRREVTQVDVGDDDLDELPDDAAEVAATYQKKEVLPNDGAE
jgi:multidrug efflux pump subunit AcrB